MRRDEPVLQAIQLLKVYQRRRNDACFDQQWDEFDAQVGRFLNAMESGLLQRELPPSRWSLRRDILLARKASEYIEGEWMNRTMDDPTRWVIQTALKAFASQRGLPPTDRFLFGVPHDHMRAWLKQVDDHQENATSGDLAVSSSFQWQNEESRERNNS